MNRLERKVAIITGSGTGIGKAIAEIFAKEGAKVAITCRNESTGKNVARDICNAGYVAEYFKMDVSSECNCKNVIDAVVDKWGRLDILVNNAGVTGADKPTHEFSEEEWDYVFNINVKGVMFMTKHAIPYMKHIGKGSIINMSSIWGLVGSNELSAYHASKGAVTLMTKKDAVVYGPDNIRVNSIHPGTIITPLVEKMAEHVPGYFEREIALHPLGFLGKPEDVAYATLFLASDEARFVTGAQLTVDGGYTAQ